jgi:uncharacterized paraquat-inducible protein A
MELVASKILGVFRRVDPLLRRILLLTLSLVLLLQVETLHVLIEILLLLMRHHANLIRLKAYLLDPSCRVLGMVILIRIVSLPTVILVVVHVVLLGERWHPLLALN